MKMETEAIARVESYLAKVKEDFPKLSKKNHEGARERLKYNAYKAISHLRFIVQLANAS